MSATNGNANLFKVTDTLELDKSMLNEVTIDRLIDKGLTHIFGNEVASKITGWTKKRTEAGDPPTDVERAALTDQLRSEFVDKLLDGTWGAGIRASRGISASREETVFNQIVVSEAAKLLDRGTKGFGIVKMPKVKGEEQTWTVRGEVLTTSEFAMDQYLNHPQHGEARRAAHMESAKMQIEAERRLAAAKAEQRAALATTTADELGI